MGPFQILLVLFFCFALNLPFYGLQNRNIASNSNGNIKTAFWLGLMGPLGMIICLIQNIKPTWKKVLFGIGRFFLWAIGSQIIVELGIFSQGFVNAFILYFFGFPFILRGKNIYRFSLNNSDKVNREKKSLIFSFNNFDIHEVVGIIATVFCFSFGLYKYFSGVENYSSSIYLILSLIFSFLFLPKLIDLINNKNKKSITNLDLSKTENDISKLSKDKKSSKKLDLSKTENDTSKLSRDEIIKRLRETKELFDDGILNKEEYEKESSKLKKLLIGN